jgi:hypothetical protein
MSQQRTYRTERARIIERALTQAETLNVHDVGETNEVRASLGESGVMLAAPNFAISQNGIGPDTKDALTNIAHFCDAMGLNFMQLCHRAWKAHEGDMEDGPPARRRDAPHAAPLQ